VILFYSNYLSLQIQALKTRTPKRNSLLLLFFLLVFSPAGAQTWKWARGGGGHAADGYWGLCVSADKAYVYTTGGIQAVCEIGMDTLKSLGGYDVVIAKYDTTGNLIWTKRAGGPGDDWGSDVCADDSSNIYVTGTFYNTAIFDTDTLVGSVYSSGFLAKYTASGRMIWIRKTIGSGKGSCVPDAVEVDKQGNIVIAGAIVDTVSFGPYTLVSRGQQDCFVAKYSPSGNVIWVRSGGGKADDYYIGIDVDINNNIICTGAYNDTATFGSTTVMAGNLSNILITKYDPSGMNIWVYSAGDGGTAYAYNSSSDPLGNTYVLGSYSIKAHFDTTLLTCAGQYDLFIAKFDVNGKRKWVKRRGGSATDDGTCIATDKYGNSFISGRYESSLPGNPYVTPVFIAKYDNAGNFKWQKTVGGRKNTVYVDYGSGIDVDDLNNIYLCGELSNTFHFDSDSLTCAGQWDLFVARLHDTTGNNAPPDSVPTTISNIRIPNFFTPNNDGIDDNLNAAYANIESFDMLIYDRWGVEMAHIIHPWLGWDGKTYTGAPASDGVYYYVLSADGTDKKQFNLHGFFMLWR
jgi:gliding motility-associated-like protein